MMRAYSHCFGDELPVEEQRLAFALDPGRKSFFRTILPRRQIWPPKGDEAWRVCPGR
jgi:hypothetical protein